MKQSLARNPFLIGGFYLIASQVGVLMGHKMLLERGDSPEVVSIALSAAALSFTGTWIIIYGAFGGEL